MRRFALGFFSGEKISLRSGPAACLYHSWQWSFPLLSKISLNLAPHIPLTSHTYAQRIVQCHLRAGGGGRGVKCIKRERKWASFQNLGFYGTIWIHSQSNCVVSLNLFCFAFLTTRMTQLLWYIAFPIGLILKIKGLMTLINLDLKSCSRSHLSYCVYAHHSPSVYPSSQQPLSPRRQTLWLHRLLMATWPKLCFWTLWWNTILTTFPWNQTGGHWTRPQSCSLRPKEIIYYSFPTSGQSIPVQPAPSNQDVLWFCSIES